MLGRGVAFEIDGYESDAGDAWSVVIKGYAIEIKKLQDYFDALDLPLFPWHAGPSTASCESSLSRSRVAGSVSSATTPGEATDRRRLEPHRSDADMSDASPAELFQLDQSTCLALLGASRRPFDRAG